jgi:hypothetical protein
LRDGDEDTRFDEEFDEDEEDNDEEDTPNEDMDGDHDSCMRDIGWGMDEDYGYDGGYED